MKITKQDFVSELKTFSNQNKIVELYFEGKSYTNYLKNINYFKNSTQEFFSITLTPFIKKNINDMQSANAPDCHYSYRDINTVNEFDKIETLEYIKYYFNNFELKIFKINKDEKE